MPLSSNSDLKNIETVSSSDNDCSQWKRQPLREISSPLADGSDHDEVFTSKFSSKDTLKNFRLFSTDPFFTLRNENFD